ncbi:MAG TPA: DNA (cytosine-5-)-methyltransferase [Gaiellaceae bacterium]|nr:DNA (cytosine-5-)-methyltransferase [Gaiellaceae bacterium]
MPTSHSGPRAAEFFAGIGLVRMAIERAGFAVVWANDVSEAKRDLYVAHFGPDDFVLSDIRDVRGDDVPAVALATASFPCTDISLAGNRRGLHGGQSSMFWEFARVLEEMEDRRPAVCLLENVPSLATSNGGADLRAVIRELNRLGYVCDLFVADARRFVPQSRPRLFIVGSVQTMPESGDWQPTEVRPAWIGSFVAANPELALQAAPLRLPLSAAPTLADVVERLAFDDPRWWGPARVASFVDSLSRIQTTRLEALRSSGGRVWATAYRRTRNGRAVWEIRADGISGCLRTARGGSSKQALVEAGRGEVRVRWMTPREYARLQGAPDYDLGDARTNQALFGFGDAVCVPVVAWIARSYLRPLVDRGLPSEEGAAVA